MNRAMTITVRELMQQVQFVFFTQLMFKYTKAFTIFYAGFQFILFADHTGEKRFFNRVYLTFVWNKVPSLTSGPITVFPRW